MKREIWEKVKCQRVTAWETLRGAETWLRNCVAVLQIQWTMTKKKEKSYLVLAQEMKWTADGGFTPGWLVFLWKITVVTITVSTNTEVHLDITDKLLQWSLGCSCGLKIQINRQIRGLLRMRATVFPAKKKMNNEQRLSSITFTPPESNDPSPFQMCKVLFF